MAYLGDYMGDQRMQAQVMVIITKCLYSPRATPSFVLSDVGRVSYRAMPTGEEQAPRGTGDLDGCGGTGSVGCRERGGTEGRLRAVVPHGMPRQRA